MGQFKPVPKMKTTEPSVELKLKKGGKVKMMDGGTMPMATAPAMPARRRMPARAAVPAKGMAARGARQTPVLLRKKGGETLKEIEAHERNEEQEIKRVKGELKKHESMKASKAHQGLKNGGSPAPKAGPNVMGGLEGGLEATRTVKSKTTGGVRSPGYKNGGALNAKGMALAKKYQGTMNDASKQKTVKGNKGIEGAGYKDGGKLKKYASGGLAAKGMAIANKYQTKINDASSNKKTKGSTGSLEGSKFKNGGHAAMSCKAEGGFTAMKKMSKC